MRMNSLTIVLGDNMEVQIGSLLKFVTMMMLTCLRGYLYLRSLSLSTNGHL